MFPLAFHTDGLYALPLEQAIHEVADAGYEAVELSLHPNHIDAFSFTRHDAESIRKTLEKAGITACCLAAGAPNLLSDIPFEPSLIHPDESSRQRRINLLLRAIDIARWLDIPAINFASGKRQPEVSVAQADKYLREGLLTLLDAADNDVMLAMEPEPEFFAETNSDVVRIHDALGSDNFSLCQDLGHCRVAEDDYLTSTAQALPVTTHFQVEDIKERHHRHEIPGDGDIDFPAFFTILQQGGYTGYLSVELYNHGHIYREALRRSHAFLRAAEQAAANS